MQTYVIVARHLWLCSPRQLHKQAKIEPLRIPSRQLRRSPWKKREGRPPTRSPRCVHLCWYRVCQTIFEIAFSALPTYHPWLQRVWYLCSPHRNIYSHFSTRPTNLIYMYYYPKRGFGNSMRRKLLVCCKYCPQYGTTSQFRMFFVQYVAPLLWQRRREWFVNIGPNHYFTFGCGANWVYDRRIQCQWCWHNIPFQVFVTPWNNSYELNTFTDYDTYVAHKF